MKKGSGADVCGFRGFAVVGCTGSGKTTLARKLASQLNLQHIELDALFHQANWTPTPSGEFQSKVSMAIDRAEAEGVGWITCGNYLSVSDLLHHRKADCVIWLDLPRSVVMRRVIGRTVKRALIRQELWNGNREKISNLYHWNPERNIIRWAWTKYPEVRSDYETKLTDGSWEHLAVFRLRTVSEVDAFLEDVSDANRILQ